MNNIVRAFVVVLAVTGAAATTLTSHASTSNKVTVARASCLPVPMCAPGGGETCGWKHN